MDSTRNAIQWCPLSRAQPVFDFLMSTEASDKNFALLKDNDFDLERILFVVVVVRRSDRVRWSDVVRRSDLARQLDEVHWSDVE